jgi:hypothetical protein
MWPNSDLGGDGRCGHACMVVLAFWVVASDGGQVFG